MPIRDRLTDLKCRSASPGAKAKRLWDGAGLYLEVAPSGGKWWRLKYRVGAKERRISLGVYPEVFEAGAAFSGVPYTCFRTTNGSEWN